MTEHHQRILYSLRDYEMVTGYTPTRKAWDSSNLVRSGRMVSSRQVIRRFGSWNTAIEAAGLEANQPGWGRRG